MKKTLQKYCSEIEVWDNWLTLYKHFVPLFINEAMTKSNWEDWDNEVFHEFFERSNDQCVSSLKQGYFTKEEKKKIKSNWHEIAPLLKIIAQNQDSPQWDIYQELKKKIRSLTNQDRRAATNRMIASLQPELLCTIVNENNLYELFIKLKKYTSETIPDYVGGNWFKNSYNICKLFQNSLQYDNALDIVTYPWEILEHLKHIEKEHIDMSTYIDTKITLLEKNHNLIFTGAPGTGKTHLAKQVAMAIIGVKSEDELEQSEQFAFVQFHPSYDYTDFVEGLRPTPPDSNGNIGFERKDGIFKAFCKRAIQSEIIDTVDNFEECWIKLIDALNNHDFLEIPLLSGKDVFKLELNVNGDGLAHRTYENGDFDKGAWLQGKSKFFNKEQLYNVYRGQAGIPSGGHDNYRKAIVQYMKDNLGLQDYFKGERSMADTRQRFVFIIDEINRGEISKIFGELFFSIDPGYRGKKGTVKTQYQNMIVDESDPFYNGFYVPENVYIIGTMNDIDRSVESMDFAMRRRFAWEEIKAGENLGMLDMLLDLKDEVVGVMNRLNKAIWDEENNTGIEGLNAAYHIGGAYFSKIQMYSDEEDISLRFKHVWDNHLKGIISEYLRGMPDAAETLKMLEAVYYNKSVNNDID